MMIPDGTTYRYVDEDDNDGNLLHLIPNVYYKKSQLEKQWIANGWYYDYPSVRDYVKSLAYSDDVNYFLGWLFSDVSFDNASAWSLPYEYESALQQFFNLFYNLDD